jgi:hypothetical protein
VLPTELLQNLFLSRSFRTPFNFCHFFIFAILVLTDNKRQTALEASTGPQVGKILTTSERMERGTVIIIVIIIINGYLTV